MDLRTIVLCGVVGSSVAASVAAQGFPPPPDPRFGGRVRLTLAEASVQGYLVARDAERLTLAFPGEGPFASSSRASFPLASVERIELSVGTKRHARLGAAIGLVVLGLTGLSAPIDRSPSCDSSSTQPCSRGEAVFIAAAAGALLGGAVGHFVTTDHWVPLAKDALPVFPPSPAEVRAAPGGSAAADFPPAVRWTVRF
jgi:hypothetical protein